MGTCIEGTIYFTPHSSTSTSFPSSVASCVTVNAQQRVIVLMEKMMKFKEYVRDVKLMLECLKPVIYEIAEYIKVLNQPMEELQALISRLENSEDLVRKCSKVGAWSFCKKYRYTNQLDQLDKSLHSVLNVLELQKTRDLRETMITVRKIETVVQRIEGNVSRMQISQLETN